MELIQALPVTRQSLWLWRYVSVLVVLAGITAATTTVIVASLGAFSLEEVSGVRVAAATVACGLLAAFHGAVAYAVGGFGVSRGLAVGVAILVLFGGYVINFLFPLSNALAGLRRLSPWYWAIGEQPVSDGVSWSWLALLVGVTAIIVTLGTTAVGRRDIRPA